MSPPTLFVDTWGWLVLEDGADVDHDRTAASYDDFRRSGGGAVTTDYVLDETVTRLFRRRPFTEARKFMEGLLASAAGGYLAIERITRARFARAWELRLRYDDKQRISFTDLTSFVVMQEAQVADVLTQDEHFAQVNMGFVRRPE